MYFNKIYLAFSTCNKFQLYHSVCVLWVLKGWRSKSMPAECTLLPVLFNRWSAQNTVFQWASLKTVFYHCYLFLSFYFTHPRHVFEDDLKLLIPLPHPNARVSTPGLYSADHQTRGLMIVHKHQTILAKSCPTTASWVWVLVSGLHWASGSCHWIVCLWNTCWLGEFKNQNCKVTILNRTSQMVERHLGKWSVSLVIWEMLIKTTQIPFYTNQND